MLSFHQYTVVGLGLLAAATLAVSKALGLAVVALAVVVFAAQFGSDFLTYLNARKDEDSKRRELDEGGLKSLAKQLADEVTAREKLDSTYRTYVANNPAPRR